MAEAEQQKSFPAMVGSGSDLSEYSELGFGRRILGSTSEVKVVLAAFHPGQEIPPHSPDVDLVVSVLEGDGQVRIDDEVHHVRVGDVALIPAGSARGIRGGEAGMVALHVVSPPPTPADHETHADSVAWLETEGHGLKLGEHVRHEHAELRPNLEGLADLADEIGDLAADERDRRFAETLEFLDALQAHAGTEEKALYPATNRVLRARGGALGTMLLGHEAIISLSRRFADAVESNDVDVIPRLLHSLSAIALLHLDEEEKVYLPMLTGLSTKELETVEHSLGHGHDHV